MAAIELRNIEKTYNNGPRVIDDLNLEINDGEFVVFVGPSGCGKSTLLRMIAGLEKITGGDLIFDDVRVNDTVPGKRGISMVFQNYALYPHMSVYENMAYGLKNIGTDKEEIERRIHKVSTMLKMDHLLERKPREMSGGQQQRVAIGRAIVKEPMAFLFDEPLSNLDAALRQKMRTEISLLHKKLQTTMIYVTHDQIEAMTMADKIVVLKDGYIEQVGTPMEVYTYPQTRFVAEFIGAPKMNFFDNEETATAVINQIGFSSLLLKSDRISVGVRPKDISIVEGGNFGEAKITFMEKLGDETVIFAKRISGGEKVVIKVDGHKNFQIGEIIGLNINTEALHMFDEKGHRISVGDKHA